MRSWSIFSFIVVSVCFSLSLPAMADATLGSIKIEEIVTKASKAYNQKDFPEALRLYRQAAAQGNVTAKQYVGMLLFNGQGAQRDVEGAVKLLREAANEGNAAAQRSLGTIYKTGQGAKQDFAASLFWYQKAAVQGDPEAQRDLGKLYIAGSGVPVDAAVGMRWLVAAAQQGDVEAQASLGYIYDQGKLVPRDPKLSMDWYGKAAVRGNATAQNAIGEIFYYGLNSTLFDSAEAVRWFWLAAKQGNREAQANLGMSYRDGRGVEKNLVDSARWYRLAAEQGSAAAQFEIGGMYYGGQGVGQDRKEAVKWFEKAAVQNYAAAKEKLDFIAQVAKLGKLPEFGRFVLVVAKGTPGGAVGVPGIVVCPDQPTAKLVESLYIARRQDANEDMVLGLGGVRGREVALLKGSRSEGPVPERYGCGLVAPHSPMLADPTMRLVSSVVAMTVDGRVIRGVMSVPPAFLSRVN